MTVIPGNKNEFKMPPPAAESYAFIMNVAQLNDPRGYMLAPSHLLRRATAKEVAFIKTTLQRSAPAPHDYSQYLWEQRLPHRGCEVETLPGEEWRYFVIAFNGSNATALQLERAFDLARLELEVGFTAVSIGQGYGVVSIADRFFHVLNDATSNDSFFVDVSAADIDEIRTIHERLQQHDGTRRNIQSLVMQLGQLKGFPHSSPLRFLGYCTISRGAAHACSTYTDHSDSITRQIKRKLALLNNRFQPLIDYAPFGGLSSDKIWGKMYAYRSCLAHGGTPQFAGELKELRNHAAALKLIKEAVKSVICQALLDPQLLLDLKEC